jgi:PST family polysaccharide transporter
MGYPFFGALNRLELANRSVLIAGVIQIVALTIFWYYGWKSPIDVALTVLTTEIFVMGFRVIVGVNEYAKTVIRNLG